MPKKRTLDDFIASARKVHGDRYDYSNAEYKGAHSKLGINYPYDVIEDESILLLSILTHGASENPV